MVTVDATATWYDGATTVVHGSVSPLEAAPDVTVVSYGGEPGCTDGMFVPAKVHIWTDDGGLDEAFEVRDLFVEGLGVWNMYESLYSDVVNIDLTGAPLAKHDWEGSTYGSNATQDTKYRLKMAFSGSPTSFEGEILGEALPEYLSVIRW